MSKNHDETFETKPLSSLVKVFPTKTLNAIETKSMTVLKSEFASFQIAYKSTKLRRHSTIKIESDINDNIKIYKVGLVPSELPNYEDHDDDVLSTEPGLFPDPLYPFETLNMLPNQWRSVWITVDTKNISKIHNINISFYDENSIKLGEESFSVDIIDVKLINSGVKHTEWFYLDCIADNHHVEIFSEEHFQLIENYVENYVEHGMDTILTPLFTPPLEMITGEERPTIQLVNVKKLANDYEFDFSLLKRFIDLCNKKGVKYYELSHLFSQWGASYALRVLVDDKGKLVKEFDYKTSATDEKYVKFLTGFLLKLHEFLKLENLVERCLLHISDEPCMANIESYEKAAKIVRDLNLPYPIFDALSDYDFYEKGFVDYAVASTEHINKFIENDAKNLWAYYCCCEYKGLSNRFFSMPSRRTRIIGFQLYKYDIKGFLHWGYNHWYSAKSEVKLDPYKVTDALAGFPSGDAFLVYPGENGPICSIRLKIMQQAFQDITALKTLESFIGREKVICLIDEDIQISFLDYSKEEEWISKIREKVNALIKKYNN